jgi:hypothetical protein
MKIIGWTDFDNPQYKEMYPIGGFGTVEQHEEIANIIAKELRDKGYKFNGYYHQGGDYGVPIFDNGMTYQCTFRTWGGIMARAYPDEIDNSDGLGYVEWAWTIPDGQEIIVPCESDYEMYT